MIEGVCGPLLLLSVPHVITLQKYKVTRHFRLHLQLAASTSACKFNVKGFPAIQCRANIMLDEP